MASLISCSSSTVFKENEQMAITVYNKPVEYTEESYVHVS